MKEIEVTILKKISLEADEIGILLDLKDSGRPQRQGASVPLYNLFKKGLVSAEVKHKGTTLFEQVLTESGEQAVKQIKDKMK